MDNSYFIGDREVPEIEFVGNFTSIDGFYQYLVDFYDEGELDIDDLKRAFLNQDMDFHYSQCVRFEESYLK